MNLPRAPTRTVSDSSTGAKSTSSGNATGGNHAGATVLSGEDGMVVAGRGNAEESWSALVQSHHMGQSSHMSELDSPLSPPANPANTQKKGPVRPSMVTRPSQLHMSHLPTSAADLSDAASEKSYFPPQLTRESMRVAASLCPRSEARTRR